MKLLIDKNIPYQELFFGSLGMEIENFSDNSFNIGDINHDSIVVIRSTYSTHGRAISSKIKLICSVSTGEDHIDRSILSRQNIPLKFSTGANAKAVQEYTISCLALLLKLNLFQREIDKILVIGVGKIGSMVIDILKEYNFSYDSYDPYKESSLEKLDNLSDYKLITFHVPYTKEGKNKTKYYLDANFLSKVNSDAVIINTSRGGIVDENHFHQQDKCKLISDVFIDEPNISAKFCKKTFLATPHIAGHTQSSRFEMTKMAYEHVIEFLGIQNNITALPKIYKLEVDETLVEAEINKYGLPVTLILNTYNPKEDSFSPVRFKQVRDDYNKRIGFDQIQINNLSDDVLVRKITKLGFNYPL